MKQICSRKCTYCCWCCGTPWAFNWGSVWLVSGATGSCALFEEFFDLRDMFELGRLKTFKIWQMGNLLRKERAIKNKSELFSGQQFTCQRIWPKGKNTKKKILIQILDGWQNQIGLDQTNENTRHIFCDFFVVLLLFECGEKKKKNMCDVYNNNKIKRYIKKKKRGVEMRELKKRGIRFWEAPFFSFFCLLVQ